MNSTLRRHDPLLVVLAVIGMAPFIHAELGSDPDRRAQAYVFLAMAVACAMAAVVGQPNRSGKLRLALMRLLPLAGVSYAAIEIWVFVQVPIIALGHFVITLACAKFLELNAARDRLVIVVISLLMLIVGAMISANLVLGGVLVIYLTLGLYWLTRFNIDAEADAVWRRTLDALSPAERRLASDAVARESSRFSLLPITVVYGGALAIFIVVTFLTLPRELIRRQFELRVPPSMSGFTSHVGLNDIGPVSESDQPVLRARFRVNGEAVGGPDDVYYLRGATLDEYRNGRWKHYSVIMPKILRGATRGAPLPMSPGIDWVAPSNRLEQEIWLDPSSRREAYLFSAFPALAMFSTDIRAIEIDLSDRTMKIGQLRGGGMSYYVWSPRTLDADVAVRLEAGDAGMSVRRLTEGDSESVLARIRGGDSERSDRLVMVDPGEVIEGFDRRRFGPRGRVRADSSIPSAVADVARSVIGTDALPVRPESYEQTARTIESFLRSEQFTYTLNPPRRARGMEPIEAFLLNSRRGFCTHFASAMTLMCQSLGMPARLVTGYRTGEFNEMGQFYRVREKDAHAWVEVQIPGRYWMRFDPTPAVARVAAADVGWLAAIRNWYHYLQFEWASVVVSFDAEHGRELMNAVRRWWTEVYGPESQQKSLSDRARELAMGPAFFSKWQRMIYWSVAVLLAAFVVAVLRALWIIAMLVRRRLPTPRWVRTGAATFSTRFYGRLLALLARQGFVKPASFTPREFARDLIARRPDLVAMERLTDWYYEARYGRLPPDRERRRVINGMLDSLRNEGRLDAGEP
ncbi:MAG: DUF3488 and transglutaminase-like domain-containing protein [Phycisphaerae bacterium]